MCMCVCVCVHVCVCACVRVCHVRVCPCSERKMAKLSTPNLVYIYSMAVAQRALTQRSKGQGHMVMKTITDAQRLLYCMGPSCILQPCTAFAGLELHII